MKKHYYSAKRHLKHSGILRGVLTAMLLFCSLTAMAHAQPAKLDVDFNGNTLEQVISFLKENSNYDFVYRKGMLPADLQVNLKLQNATVEEILEHSLPRGLSFEVSNNVVVINRTPVAQVQSQTPVQRFTISGTIYETRKDGTQIPLPLVAVVAQGLSLHAITDANGQFTINNVPRGQTILNISMLGKRPVTRELNVTENVSLEIVMEDDNFRVQDIVVTAEGNKAGEATSSVISRTAIDHLQATSLQDVMSLIPGGLITNPNLNLLSQINIRGIAGAPHEEYAVKGEALNMNAMGVSLIQNGAPVSNNANMQTRNPVIATAGNEVTSFGGGANPVGGIDTRTISMENVESIEVIRGIPSVEYGDVSSGMVIVNTKAGREPLRITSRVNQNLYMFGAGAGYNLGDRKGALNISVDYTNNLTNPVHSYDVYQRNSAQLMYSNAFMGGKWRTNTSLNYHYANDATRKNPDDEKNKRKSYGNEHGISLSTNGSIQTDWGWLKNIRYVLRGAYTMKDSYSQSIVSNAYAPYSGTTIDGAILSNTGQDFYDTDGNKITNIPNGNTFTATYLPASYMSKSTIEGREVNLYAKLMATLAKRLSQSVDNRILLGFDFKSDGNEGNGLTFKNDEAPPRTIFSPNSSFRPRPYKDLPYVNQFGAFLEENINMTFRNGGQFNIQAGVRFDNVSSAGSLIAPRINASIDIIPRVLTLRGGYGVAGKMPTLLFLYPEDAYFEYINASNLSYETDALKQVFITTTRIFETQNKDLEIARNKKAELGFDLRIANRYRMRVTAFSERMNNGYELRVTENSIKPVVHQTYTVANNAEGIPEITKEEASPKLASYTMPTNDRVINSKGIELELDLGRFDAIRTSFVLNGAWTRTETYSKSSEVYGINLSGSDGHIALYAPANTKRYYEQVVTTLRATHNIPEIGFVITLTGQVLWREANWYKFNNELRPEKYISYLDGKIYDFPTDAYDDLSPEFRPLSKEGSFNNENRKKEVFSPVTCFNINVTKELGDYFRISFFANNMFRHYPSELQVRKTTNGLAQYTRRNINFMFGLELSLTIK